jgi:signal peptidase I
VVLVTLLAGLLVVTFFRWVMMPIQIVGDSMAPTYLDGNRHFLNRLAYRNATPQRGDVVAFHQRGEIYIKRIVALPGEWIETRPDGIYVDGERLEEPEIRHSFPWAVELKQIPDNQYFVMGDNRKSSVFGTVERDQIIGRVLQ